MLVCLGTLPWFAEFVWERLPLVNVIILIHLLESSELLKIHMD